MKDKSKVLKEDKESSDEMKEHYKLVQEQNAKLQE